MENFEHEVSDGDLDEFYSDWELSNILEKVLEECEVSSKFLNLINTCIKVSEYLNFIAILLRLELLKYLVYN